MFQAVNITEFLSNYEKKYGSLRKFSTPMSKDEHPELDDSDFLPESGINQYQQILGVFHWLLVCCWFNIEYATCSLSRFQVAPLIGHLDLAKKKPSYLKKYKKRGYIVNPNIPKFDIDATIISLKQDFGSQYHYFSEDIDPRFPETLFGELDINIFVDSDHGHDKIT